MANTIKSSFYGNQHSVINSMSDHSLVVNILVEDIVFKYQPNWETKKIKFINLYIHETKMIAAGYIIW